MDKPTIASASRTSALHCIDLAEDDIAKSVSLLKQACVDCGFFYVINHGISPNFMDEVFRQSKRFFDLPINEKLKVLRDEKHRGYTPVLDETLDPANQVHGDVKEGYYIGIEVSEDNLDPNKPFYGPNPWPCEASNSKPIGDEWRGPTIYYPYHNFHIFKYLLPGWRWTMEQYHQKAMEVAKAVARIIALALDLDDEFFDRPEMLGEPIATLRLLHYEGKVSDPKSGIYGAGAHTDYGLITLLATDDVMGLQICRDKDVQPQIWEYVPPLKGALIVNLGDMLERWSNCIFRSTLHRVLIDRTERYSIAYFVEPSHDCMVECLPSCYSDTNPPKFPPVKCATYLSQRYKDTHSDLRLYREKKS